MSRKRISELAKEWGVETKEIVVRLEKLGMKGRKAQSSLTEEEAVRVHEDLGVVDKPVINVGGERVVEEEGQTVVERRVRTNVIRRRTTRREDEGSILPPVTPFPGGLESESFVPPGLGELRADATSEPAVPPPPPPAPPVEQVAAVEDVVEVEPPPAPVETPAIETAPSESPRAAVEATEAPAPEPAAAPAVAKPPAVEPRRPRIETKPAPPPLENVSSEPMPAPPPAPAVPRMPEVQGPKVLGRIDLKKTEAARQAERVAAQKRAVAAQAPPPPVPGPDGAPPAEDDSSRKRKGKRRVIKKGELGDSQDREQRPGRRPTKRRVMPGKEVRRTEITTPKASKRIVRISEVITVGELAKAMGVKATEVVKKLMDSGIMATINQILDTDTATLIASEFDYNVENVAFDAEMAIEEGHEAPTEEDKTTRSAVVTIMGHVDHGKTSLLDSVRETNVTAQEAGGITQHIGAYSVEVHGRQVTFLDTPGHEAFTAMRARGAKVTDVVVLVVAADDGVMPQTIEAINHARAAEVPIVVAINKIDKPDANIERLHQELANHGLVPEEWGGDTVCVKVSALTKEGIPQLLEMLLLQADLLDLKANGNKLARGTIVEARLDRGRGPVATVLVQEGTLHVGDPFVCGGTYGRVRAMMDDKGRKVQDAGPSMPVEILGLQDVPEAGHPLVAVADEATARQVAEHRRSKQREADLIKTSKVSLEDLYQQIQSGDVKELRVILKADVQGSVEALSEALRRMSTDEVRLSVLHSSVGGISESDVLLASASNAIIIGFNVRPESKATDIAEREGVDVRLYNVIYDAVNEVRDAMEGLLEPMVKEKTTGRAEVRQVFVVSGVGAVAGCYILDGKVTRNSSARLVRDHVVVYDGRLSTLRRFKEDAREVAAGFECGIGLENYSDVKSGDIIETYETERVVRRLTPSTKGAGAERRV